MHIRESHWKVAPIPRALQDRRVEITGPTDPKMVINALNSGATCYMADFEDSNTPTFDNLDQGQLNLRNAWLRQIDFTNEAGKSYALSDEVATLVVRNRGWHLPERHVLVDGEPVSGSLFDFCLYMTTSAQIATPAARAMPPISTTPTSPRRPRASCSSARAAPADARVSRVRGPRTAPRAR